MSNQKLQMKYHPAKKEVEFKRFQSSQEIPIRSDSKLTKYMNKKGRFVLQDHGKSFFEDITRAFDGEKTVKIEVITTKIDFEDFKQMIEHFNVGSTCHIDATLLCELPDMNETFHTVKEHGEKSMKILKEHQAKFHYLIASNDSVKTCVENFSAEVLKEVKSIEEKISSLNENSINLCFAGVYSAGKSALINAILGYSILPENINSETAQIFRIQSPEHDKPVRITLNIQNDFTEIVWNKSAKYFEFTAGPSESVSRRNIQTTINMNKEKLQHIQICEILKTLNNDKDFLLNIKIFFPIPLDNGKVQFTIYDTPGTDSNYNDHQQVLEHALTDQTHSILIFVVAPNKTEGEGNNALLNYLKEVDQKDSKTSIDIGRSLFVMNWADSIEIAERNDLNTAEIRDKNDEKLSIKLADKKLFFTSAKIAYAAKANKNGIATGKEDYVIEFDGKKASNEKYGCYYQQNRCATSEFATKEMISRSDEALKNAKKKNDNNEILHICSGLHALETEIITYGEKYSSAVKAFAIIDSVDKALAKMNNSAKSLEGQTQGKIEKNQAGIELLRRTIYDIIQRSYEKRAMPKDVLIPDDVLKRLHLDKESLMGNVIGKPKSFIDKLLRKGFFGLGKVKFKENDKKFISECIVNVLDDFTSDFKKARRNSLEELRDGFIEEVKKAIQDNGELSDKAKQYVLDIRSPEVKECANIADFGELYDSHKRSDKFLFFEREYIDKDKFIQVVEEKLAVIADGLYTDYGKDYRKSIVVVLKEVEDEFINNIEKYSVLIKALLEEKEVMEQLQKLFLEVASSLEECQEELNCVIWSGEKNG